MLTATSSGRESEVRELLPIQGYSQKQLSSVAVRLDELTRFVTAPIRRELADIDRTVEESAGKVRETYSTVQRYRALRTSIQRLTLHERSLAEQASNLRAPLPTVSEEDRAVLASKPAYDQACSVHEQVVGGATQVVRIAERLNEVVQQVVESLPEVPEDPEDVASAPKPRQQLFTKLSAASRRRVPQPLSNCRRPHRVRSQSVVMPWRHCLRRSTRSTTT